MSSLPRLAQAAWDEQHEDPSIFNDALGRDLTKLPQTWALLKALHCDEAQGYHIGKPVPAAVALLNVRLPPAINVPPL